MLSQSVPAIGAVREREDRGRFAPDAEVREAFDDAVRRARASVVGLIVDDKPKVLGTVVDEDGYVLTKASEVVDADRVVAQLPGGKRVDAKLIGVDRKNDLAMLKVDAPRLRAVQFESKEPRPGFFVASVGMGTSPTAVGIISARSRVIKPPQIVLGVVLREHPKGLFVFDVSEGMGAARAGVRAGDVLTRVAGKDVIAVKQVVDRLQAQAQGDVVPIEVLRDEKTVRLSVGLEELAPDPRSRSERMNRMGGDISERRRGFERVLQHDAEIEPEHCGGPLVNLDGEVVGLNIARAGRISTYALPSGLIKQKLAALKSGKLMPGRAGEGGEPVQADPAKAAESKQ